MLENRSLLEIQDLLKGRKISVSELYQFYQMRVEKFNPEINAFIHLVSGENQFLSTLDDHLSRVNWDEKPLYGLPLGIKDMFCTKGVPTTAASKMLENFVPPYDATVIQLLKKAGALVFGKLNQDEFAMGSSNETSYFGPCRNPWNLEYVPGGSSGGSAAAVAADLCPASLGTDTGGSIRQPAHFCGIVGVKPTYGRISRYGIVAFASSLDQAGPMTKTVKDAALLLRHMCGYDPQDHTSADVSVPDWLGKINPSMEGKKVGVIEDFMGHPELEEAVWRAVSEVQRALEKLGAKIVPIRAPISLSHGISVYYLVASSEASSNLARYDGVRYGFRASEPSSGWASLHQFYAANRSRGFGFEVKSRILLGTYALSRGYYDAYYMKASQVRRLIRDEFLQNFQSCDVILTPVATSGAFRLGERRQNPLQMYLNDIFTVPVNLAGLPAMSLPVLVSDQGLPIGVQLIAKPWNEQVLFDVGVALEDHFQFPRSQGYARFKF